MQAAPQTLVGPRRGLQRVGARAVWAAAALLLAAAPAFAQETPAPAPLPFGVELELVGVEAPIRTTAERTEADYRRIFEPIVRHLGGDPAEITFRRWSAVYTADGAPRPLMAAEYVDAQGRTWKVTPEWVRGGGRQQVDFEVVTPKLTDPAELEGVITALSRAGVAREGLQSSVHIHVDGARLVTADGDATGLINLINLHEGYEPLLRRLLRPSRGAGIFNPKASETGAEGAWHNRFARPLYADHPELLRELAALGEGERTRARVEELFQRASAREVEVHGFDGLGTKGWKYRALNLANVLAINPELPPTKGSIEFRMNDLDLSNPATHRLEVELYRALVRRAEALARAGRVVPPPSHGAVPDGVDPAVALTSADPAVAKEQIRSMLRELGLDPVRYEGLLTRNVRAPPLLSERDFDERLRGLRAPEGVTFSLDGATSADLDEVLDPSRREGRAPLIVRVPTSPEAQVEALARARGLAERADAALALAETAGPGRSGGERTSRVTVSAEGSQVVLTIAPGEVGPTRLAEVARLLANGVAEGAAVAGGLPPAEGLAEAARRYARTVEGRTLSPTAVRALESLARQVGARSALPGLDWAQVEFLPEPVRRDLRFRAERFLERTVALAEAGPVTADGVRQTRDAVREWGRETRLADLFVRSLLPPARSTASAPRVEPVDRLARYRRSDGTLKWRELTRDRALQEGAGVAHFALALFLKEVAVVAATGDRARIEEFFDGLLTTDFYKQYGLFVAGARVGEVAYTRYLQRYVKPKFVNGMLKTNLVLAAGMALPLIVEGKFEGKAFAISLGSLGLSSAAVKAGVEGIKWVMDLRKAKQAGTLARIGVAGSRLARIGGWFYTAAELAVVLFVAEKIEGEVNAYLDREAARDALADAGERFLAAANDAGATPESVAAAAQAYHEAWIDYRNFLYGPLHMDEALLAGRLERVARQAKIKADERTAAVDRLARNPALKRSIERRYGSLEAYADARSRDEEAEIEREVNLYLDSYKTNRDAHLDEVYRDHQRGTPFLHDVDHLIWLLAGGKAGADGDPYHGRTDAFAGWGRSRAQSALRDALEDPSLNRLEAYDDEANVLALVANSLHSRGRSDLAEVVEGQRDATRVLKAADQRLVDGGGLIDARSPGMIEALAPVGGR